MKPIKDLKYIIDLIDYLYSEENILMEQTNNYIRSQNELEDTREPDSFYPLCFY